MPDRKLRVFLCHASQDKPIVRELYQRLLAEDWIDPWLDKEKLLPGQTWEMEIEKSVERAGAVIICLSKSSVTKEGYYQKEIKKILDVADEKPEGTIFIIPLRLDDCELPPRLAKWEYVDYFPEDHIEESYRRILDSLKIRSDEIRLKEKQREITSALLLEESLKHLQPDPGMVNIVLNYLVGEVDVMKVGLIEEALQNLGYRVQLEHSWSTTSWIEQRNGIYFGNESCLEDIQYIQVNLRSIINLDPLIPVRFNKRDLSINKRMIRINLLDSKLFC